MLLVRVVVLVLLQGLEFFFEHQQRGGFGERLLFPRELALERANPLHRRQRRPPFLAEGQSPLLVFGQQYALALEEIRSARHP